jgi:hypothetical protein
MQNNKSHRRLVWLIFIPPLFAICVCLAFSAPQIFKFLNSDAFPDFLWTQRITRTLSGQGYSIHDFVNVSRSQPELCTIVAVGVSKLVHGEQPEPYELVKGVHAAIIKSYEETFPRPQPVDITFVVVEGELWDSYAVEISFEYVQEFQAGQISEQEYLEHWILHPDTIEITPP